MNFSDYASGNQQNPSLSKQGKKLLSEFLGKYNGKSKDELIAEIFKTATEQRKQGVLTNSDIDAFSQMLMPMLTTAQKKQLNELIDGLKSV